MTNESRGNLDASIAYALIWGWLHLANHRYGTIPSGQMQVTLTMILLNELDYHPTVTELAELTGLAKSNVSRYVSTEMRDGFIEEYIDPSDRRRRKLRPTKKAGPELEWQQQRVTRIFELVREQSAKLSAEKPLDFEQLIENLKAITNAAGAPD
jgi:DNA-binding MarR family transcriptional regulator